MGAAPAGSLTPLTVYRREVHASLARIWENVLDWEHLPWLHRTSFLDVRLLEESPDGWCAEVRLPPASGSRIAEIAVRLERDARRYRTTTRAGFGAGTDIVTELAPTSDRATAITVAFHVPHLDPSQHAAVAAAYTRLYERLWNEDEAMMVRRQALLDRGRRGNAPSASVTLGNEDDVRARLPLVARVGDHEVRIAALADGELVAHPTVCPHLGGPLAEAAVDDDCVTCPWHGYRFDLRTAASADRKPYRLRPAALVTVDAGVVTVTCR